MRGQRLLRSHLRRALQLARQHQRDAPAHKAEAMRFAVRRSKIGARPAISE